MDQQNFDRLLETEWFEALIKLDSRGCIVHFNPEATEMLGWELLEVSGVHIHNLACQHNVYSHHDKASCPLCDPSDHRFEPRESYWTCKNGENVLFSFRKLVSDQGEVLLLFNSCERQGFQVGELMKLSKFTELNPAPLAELDSQGLMLFSNPAMTDLMLEFGFDEEGAPAILPGDLAALVARTLEVGEFADIESSAVNEQGEACHYLWRFNKNAGVQGSSVLLCGLDISSRKQAEAQRVAYERELEQEKERMRQEYLAMMVHELRSPLNAVVGFANVLKLKLVNQVDDADLMLFDEIIKGGNRLAEQISSTLDSSKVERAKISADICHFDAAPVLRKVCGELDSTALEKNLALNCELHGGSQFLNADPQHFRQIAINLISNAVKYTDAGSISVFLEHQASSRIGHCVSLTVKDTGCGIPDSQKGAIFKLYNRQASHEDSQIEGDGYGLAIVAEMVELNGGHIDVESVVGHGSTFTVLFPA